MGRTDEGFHESPLWAFSLQHYAKPGVKQACLALQDGAGLDVNVALACLWHERRGGKPLSERDIGALLEALAPSRHRVVAIRRIRRDAEDAAGAAALYQSLKHAELQAENLVQLALYEALHSWSCGQPGDGRASLRAYAAHQRKTLPPTTVEAFTGE